MIRVLIFVFNWTEYSSEMFFPLDIILILKALNKMVYKKCTSCLYFLLEVELGFSSKIRLFHTRLQRFL